MNTRTNGNYTIFESHRVSNDLEIVLGYCSQSDFYVCWSCYNKDDYRAGCYSENYETVKENYLNRIA